jgi:hypothetical protein
VEICEEVGPRLVGSFNAIYGNEDSLIAKVDCLQFSSFAPSLAPYAWAKENGFFWFIAASVDSRIALI